MKRSLGKVWLWRSMVWALLATGLSPVWAQRAVPLQAVRTVSGCEVQVPKGFTEGGVAGMQTTFTWKGACVGGLAQGLGELGIEQRGPNFRFRTDLGMTANAGIPFGYMSSRFTPDPAVPAAPMPQSVSLISEGQVTSITAGWGLSIDALRPGGSAMAIPAAAPVDAKPYQSIQGLNQSLILLKSVCLLHKDQIPACANPDNAMREVFEFSEMAVGGDHMTNFKNRKRTLCPDPFSIASCKPLVEQLGAPYRAEVLAFLQQAKPQVDALLQKLAAQSGAAPAAATPALPARSGEAAPVAGPALNLETATVGALFAAGDEAIAKGDKAAARAALRALVRRFPDHPLASNAAQLLGSLAP